jgi:CheY-like chemotaxis protein
VVDQQTVPESQPARVETRAGDATAAMHNPKHTAVAMHSPQEDAALATLALSLLSAIGEGVGLAERNGKLIWANDMLAKLGPTMLERIAMACRQFQNEHPLPPPSVTLPSGWLPPKSESTLAEGDRFYELMLTPVNQQTIDAIGPSVGKWSLCLVVLVRDVSAAKRLQHRIDAIDRAGSELVRFERDTVRRLNAPERLKLMEQKIIAVARNLLHFDHFAIRLLDERSGKLELVIAYGLPPEFDSFTIRPGLEGNGISGYVAASGRSYVCADTANDPLYLPGIIDAKSSLTVPLRVHDKVIGIMNVESQQNKAFGEEERQLGEIFGRYIAVAMHMLDLLVVERTATNATITGRVELELQEPLADIAHEVEILEKDAANDPEHFAHLERIKKDLISIKNRLQYCTAGPAGLLGVEQAMAISASDPVIAGKRVLIADDEPRIRTIISCVLERRGAFVTVCESGDLAVQAMTDAATRFDLLISDIRMPGMNGYEVFAASRKAMPGLPVILMTGFGYDPHHSIVRASQEGLQSVLFKPFQVERMLDEVRKALTKPL